METIIEKPVLITQGVITTERRYNYKKNQVIILRKLNGITIHEETFYLD